MAADGTRYVAGGSVSSKTILSPFAWPSRVWPDSTSTSLVNFLSTAELTVTGEARVVA